MHRRGKLLPQPLLDHRLPRHQAEPLAVVEHRVAPAGDHDRSPVDTSHALPESPKRRFRPSAYHRKQSVDGQAPIWFLRHVEHVATHVGILSRLHVFAGFQADQRQKENI